MVRFCYRSLFSGHLPGKPPRMKIVDVAELTTTDTKFVELEEVEGEIVHWERFSALPRNAIERIIKRPRISRYRAAWQAASAAQSATAVISHLPLTTLALCNALSLRGNSRIPHLAFSFNFTTLPSGNRLDRFRRGLARVDRFAVYTSFEKELYSEIFGIPLDRFSRLDWTQSPPLIGTLPSDLLPDEPFVAAIGGEGRDYGLVLDMARSMPDLSFVIIARPDPMFDDLPSNVRLFCNIPAPVCWAIAERSAFVLVPLRDPETCCGHITLISARLSGIPMITSRSAGTREYSEGYRATLIAEPGRTEEWVDVLKCALPRSAEFKALAAEEQKGAMIRHDRMRWKEFIEEFLRENDRIAA